MVRYGGQVPWKVRRASLGILWWHSSDKALPYGIRTESRRRGSQCYPCSRINANSEWSDEVSESRPEVSRYPLGHHRLPSGLFASGMPACSPVPFPVALRPPMPIVPDRLRNGQKEILTGHSR